MEPFNVCSGVIKRKPRTRFSPDSRHYPPSRRSATDRLNRHETHRIRANIAVAKLSALLRGSPPLSEA
jgi:hypothetical protein